MRRLPVTPWCVAEADGRRQANWTTAPGRHTPPRGPQRAPSPCTVRCQAARSSPATAFTSRCRTASTSAPSSQLTTAHSHANVRVNCGRIPRRRITRSPSPAPAVCSTRANRLGKLRSPACCGGYAECHICQAWACHYVQHRGWHVLLYQRVQPHY